MLYLSSPVLSSFLPKDSSCSTIFISLCRNGVVGARMSDDRYWRPRSANVRVGHLENTKVPTWGPIAPCPVAWWPRNGRRIRGRIGRIHNRRRKRRSMWSVILQVPAGVRLALRRVRRHPALLPHRRTAPRYFIMVSITQLMGGIVETNNGGGTINWIICTCCTWR